MMYDLKNAKKDAAEDKRKMNETGGGKYTRKLTEHGAALLALMGDQAEPLENHFDDDNNFHSLTFLNQGLPSNDESTSEVELLNDNLTDVVQLNEEDNGESKENESMNNLAISDGEKSKSACKNETKLTRKKNFNHKNRSGIRKNNENYKLLYYKTKYETALIEKRTALVNLRIAKVNLRDKLLCDNNIEYVLCDSNE